MSNLENAVPSGVATGLSPYTALVSGVSGISGLGGAGSGIAAKYGFRSTVIVHPPPAG